MTSNALPVMIFAAGFGTRMGPLTQNKAKPLVDVGGRPMIDYALDLIQEYGADRVVANAHYLGDQIKAHLEPKGILVSHEEKKILETGGGLRNALPLLGSSPVITINPDAIWQGPNPLTVVLDAWEPERMDALLLCIPKERTIGRIGPGDFTVDENGRPDRGGNMVYGGVQVIKTEALHDIPEDAFSLNILWDRMKQDNRLFCCEYTGKWCDIGRAETIRLAENLLIQDV